MTVDGLVQKQGAIGVETRRIEPHGPDRIAADPLDGLGSKSKPVATDARPSPEGIEKWIAWAGGMSDSGGGARRSCLDGDATSGRYRYLVHDAASWAAYERLGGGYFWGSRLYETRKYAGHEADGLDPSGVSTKRREEIGLIAKGGGKANAAKGLGVGFGSKDGRGSGHGSRE